MAPPLTPRRELIVRIALAIASVVCAVVVLEVALRWCACMDAPLPPGLASSFAESPAGGFRAFNDLGIAPTVSRRHGRDRFARVSPAIRTRRLRRGGAASVHTS
jgi:hypothetical protein